MQKKNVDIVKKAENDKKPTEQHPMVVYCHTIDRQKRKKQYLNLSFVYITLKL